MLDKSYSSTFRELQWLANYYDIMGQKEKAREIRDSLVNYYVKKNSEKPAGNKDVTDNDKQTGAYG